jgi:hypothetical protein
MVKNKEETAVKKRSQFAGIEDVSAYTKRIYVNQIPGTHEADVLSVKSDQKQNGLYFLSAELKITESTNPAVKPGTIVDFYVDSAKFEGTLFLKESKKFAAAVLKENVDNIEEDDLLSLVSEDQPATGEKVKIVVTPASYKKGDRKGKPVLTESGERIHNADFLPSNGISGKAA